MGWTRRGVLGAIGAGVAAAGVPARVGLGRDFAILGFSSVKDGEFDRRELIGEWKDPSWRRVVCRFEAGPRPGEVVATWHRRDGSTETSRGVLIRGRGGREFLALAPPSDLPPLPDQAVPHRLFKLAIARVDGVSIGTPRATRREFDGKVAKSYRRLSLAPLKASHLRDLPDAPPLVEDDAAVKGPAAATIAATPTGMASFLDKHGNADAVWKGPDDSLAVVRRVAPEGG